MPASASVTLKSGGVITPQLLTGGSLSGTGTSQDNNGNRTTSSTSGSITSFYDTQSSTTPVLTIDSTNPASVLYNYTGGDTSKGIMCANGSSSGFTRTTPDIPTGQNWNYVRTGTSPAYTTRITALLIRSPVSRMSPRFSFKEISRRNAMPIRGRKQALR